MKGLDAHITGGRFCPETIYCSCEAGHRWETPGYSEYGALNFADEERGPYCPACGLGDIDTFYSPERGHVSEAMPGYVLDDDGVYRIPEPDDPEPTQVEIVADAIRQAWADDVYDPDAIARRIIDTLPARSI